MIIKNKPLEIDKKNIFKNDKLGRKETIENLSSLIKSENNAFTLSINADWGAGKTTFVKLWQAYLKEEFKIKSIYFSAWEDDFSKEPLIAILGEINQYISDNYKTDNTAKEKFEEVKKIGGKILKRAIPVLLKTMTSGLVDINNNGLEEVIGAIAESSGKELIENYSKEKTITKEFKEAIQNLLQEIGDEKPFVIFIDELDRCRPLYAIELLERVKHIFGINGLVFVLSIDKKQLSESIKSQYGNIDTNNYLKRFIDMDYNLINPNLDNFCAFLYYEIYDLDNVLENKEIEKGDIEYNALAMMKYLAKSTKLSLRAIEQIFIQLSIIFKTIQPRLFVVHFRIIVLFVVLKMKFPTEYKLLLNQEIEEQVLIDLLVTEKASDKISIDLSAMIKAVILATSKTREELKQIIEKEKGKITNSVPNRLINFLEYEHGSFRDYMLNNVVNTVIKKVEFADNFNFEGYDE